MPLTPTAGTPAGWSGRSVVNNVSVNTVNYITNVNYTNGCWGGSNVCAPVWGPGSCWQSWGCNDNFSFSIGFGSCGFSFGLFYGSCNTPFCSSWCDPWWNGWCSYSYLGCAPSWNWCRPCWSPCSGPWWSNYVCASYYPTWCVPVYAYTPTYVIPTTGFVDYYYYDSIPPAFTSAEALAVTVPPSVVTVPPTSPTPSPIGAAESQAWDLLAQGFPRSAGETFAEIHDLDRANARALAGYAIALAMLDDVPAAASVMRDAVAQDVGVVAMLPMSASLRERVRLLEQSAEVASRQAGEASDALFLLGAWRTALGDFAEAHFAIVVAQQRGDASFAAAALKAFLDARIGTQA